jgi:hypothetical protein
MGIKKPVAVVEMEHGSPKANVYCAISRRRVFAPFFLCVFLVHTTFGLTMLEDVHIAVRMPVEVPHCALLEGQPFVK